MNRRGKTGLAVKRQNPVAIINDEITKLVSDLKDLNLPNFGPDLALLRGQELTDAVVASRVINKFIPGSAQDSKVLHDIAIEKMVEHDKRGFVFEPRKARADVRRILYQAKNTLHDYFNGFKPSYRFRAPTGESALSNRGEVDLMYKLRCTSHWEVSPSALPHATAICYNNLWLKRIVRAEFRSKEPTGLPWKKQCRDWYVAGMSPYEIFSKMFASLCSLNNVTRITSIPKNAKSRRVIAMVPFWNMVCQLSLMEDMRDLMYSKLGIKLDNLAQIHKGLIAHRHYATIDLSRASDSVWQSVVDFLFPGSVRKHFKRLIDKHYEVGHEYGYFNMFSPMGCGLTFDVMTTMLLFLGREFDSSTSVFGDDILIRQENAPLMFDVIEAIGMTVNYEKSYVTGSFSESCGGFYNHDDEEHIVCFDFEYATNRVEAFALVNKIFQILRARQVSMKLRCMLRATHDALLAKLKRFSVCYTTLPVTDRLDIETGFLWADDSVSQSPTVVVGLVEHYYHRRITPVMRVAIMKQPKVVKLTKASYACFFYRGESYDPASADNKTCYELIDTFSGTPFARVPLLSFI